MCYRLLHGICPSVTTIARDNGAGLGAPAPYFLSVAFLLCLGRQLLVARTLILSWVWFLQFLRKLQAIRMRLHIRLYTIPVFYPFWPVRLWCSHFLFYCYYWKCFRVYLKGVWFYEPCYCCLLLGAASCCCCCCCFSAPVVFFVFVRYRLDVHVV